MLEWKFISEIQRDSQSGFNLRLRLIPRLKDGPD